MNNQHIKRDAMPYIQSLFYLVSSNHVPHVVHKDDSGKIKIELVFNIEVLTVSLSLPREMYLNLPCKLFVAKTAALFCVCR